MITADLQTDSVGRRPGTRWLSPPQTALLATFALPHYLTPHPENLAQILASSLMSVAQTFSIFPLFKWPNDLLLSSKKLAGTMADIEKEITVISCGMNINTSKEDLAKVDIPATSLAAETGRHFDIEAIADLLNRQFSHDLSLFEQKGFAPFCAPINKYLAYRDQLVTLEGPKRLSGIVKEVHSDGRLIFEVGDKRHLIASGSLHSNY